MRLRAGRDLAVADSGDAVTVIELLNQLDDRITSSPYKGYYLDMREYVLDKRWPGYQELIQEIKNEPFASQEIKQTFEISQVYEMRQRLDKYWSEKI